jgi:hypothetical protein
MPTGTASCARPEPCDDQRLTLMRMTLMTPNVKVRGARLRASLSTEMLGFLSATKFAKPKEMALLCVIVQRLAFVDDVNREQLQRSVADDFETAVLDIAEVHHSGAGR